MPVAAFEYTADSAALAIEFFDGSFFATGWYWNFGDGTTSTQRHPVHSYAQSGAYTVCLTASNMTGSDTVCDTIQLGEITNLGEPLAREGVVRVYPNPATNEIILEVERIHEFSPHPHRPSTAGPFIFTLYDALGREVLRLPLQGTVSRVEERIDISDLPAGLYFWRVEAGGAQVGGGKVVVY
ncbi:MAG: T9SS type A sorting domain-containing protein [Saprospiraceae bacterium]|nr:T9SS type A sorting domain-containing protein [Saprospiraceae bacterium]